MRDMRPGFQVQIGPLQGRAQIAACGRGAKAAFGGDLVDRSAFHRGAVVIRVDRDLDVAGRLQKRPAERMHVACYVSNVEWPMAAAVVIGPARPGLHALEDRGDLGPGPARCIDSPIVEIAGMAAHINHGIDRARPTEDATARPVAGLAAQTVDRLGHVFPIDPGIEEGLAVADRHPDPEIEIGPTRFQQQNRMAAAITRAVGQDRAGGACSNNDIIVVHQAAPDLEASRAVEALISPGSMTFRSPCHQALEVEAVAPAVPGNDRRQEPWRSGVKRPGRKRQIVERRLPLIPPEHPLAHAHPEIASHQYPRAAIAHGIMNALMYAGMGKFVEAVGDRSQPGARDLGLGKLGEQTAHVGVQARAADLRIGLTGRHAATEQDTRPIRRGPVIIDHAAGVACDPIRREQLVNKRWWQGFGCDDVAADGDDPAAQPGCQIGRIAVGRDDDGVRADHAFRCLDAEPGTVALEGKSLTMRNDRNAGGEHGVQQPTVIFCRVQGGMIGEDDAAMIGVRAELGALLASRHGEDLRPLLLGELLGLAHQKVIMPGRMGGVKTAGTAEIAIDLFARDEILYPVEGRDAFAPDRPGALQAETPCQLFRRWLDAGADLPTVARAASGARIARLADDDARAASSDLEGRVQSGVAGADHQNIGRRRQGRAQACYRRQTIQPVGCFLVIPAQHAVTSQRLTGWSSQIVRGD